MEHEAESFFQLCAHVLTSMLHATAVDKRSEECLWGSAIGTELENFVLNLWKIESSAVSMVQITGANIMLPYSAD